MTNEGDIRCVPHAELICRLLVTTRDQSLAAYQSVHICHHPVRWMPPALGGTAGTGTSVTTGEMGRCADVRGRDGVPGPTALLHQDKETASLLQEWDQFTESVELYIIFDKVEEAQQLHFLANFGHI